MILHFQFKVDTSKHSGFTDEQIKEAVIRELNNAELSIHTKDSTEILPSGWAEDIKLRGVTKS